jgi:hypothetical protein
MRTKVHCGGSTNCDKTCPCRLEGEATYSAEPSCNLKASEEQMTRQDDKKPPATPDADQSHKPSKHVEETARLASSVEKAKNPGKVQGTKD